MGFDRKKLREPLKPPYGFSGKRIKPVRAITLPVPFGISKNPHIEYNTFNVVDMTYQYNAIFGRGLLNTFELVCIRHTCVLKYQQLLES
jgi:hypothetical protein